LVIAHLTKGGCFFLDDDKPYGAENGETVFSKPIKNGGWFGLPVLLRIEHSWWFRAAI